MAKPTLEPTPDQTFELRGDGPYDFSRVLALSRERQEAGRVEEACNGRFLACQRIEELLPDDGEVILEWNHRNSRAALELIRASAIDHFLIGDFELSAAMLELLLELDPEDHLEGTVLLAFDYIALGEYELFDEVSNDVSDKYPSKEVMTMWAAFRRTGRIPEGELARFRSRYAPYFAEFTAVEHPADERYLRDIEGERPSAAAQARELWLQTEILWTRFPDFIRALCAAASSRSGA